MTNYLEDWTATLDADMQEHGAMPRLMLDRVKLKCGSDLVPQAVRWLWRDWLALGKLHILAGAPGQGKTTIALAMASTVTRGGKWPDGTPSVCGNILVWSSEDDPADTLLPRLLASGADRKRCYFIDCAERDGEEVPFDAARDLAGLRDAIEEIGGIKLLIVDPVVSALGGTDTHKNGEVRRALQPLVDLAAECDCAVIGVSHFAKGGQGTDPAQRVVGSVAFTAVARVVMVAAKVKGTDEAEDTRILARAKSNIGPDRGGFNYYLQQSEPLPGIHASHVAWGQAVDGTAKELLAEPDEEKQEEVMDAASMLQAELADGGWTKSETVQSPLLSAGFTKKQIWTASKKLGVQRKKGMDGLKHCWYWHLPGTGTGARPPEDSKDSVEDSEDSSF